MDRRCGLVVGTERVEVVDAEAAEVVDVVEMVDAAEELEGCRVPARRAKTATAASTSGVQDGAPSHVPSPLARPAPLGAEQNLPLVWSSY